MFRVFPSVRAAGGVVLLALCMLRAAAGDGFNVAAAAPPVVSLDDEIAREYAEARRVAAEAAHWDWARLRKESATAEALPAAPGEPPAAALLRRVKALANDLAAGGVDVAAERRELAALEKQITGSAAAGGASAGGTEVTATAAGTATGATAGGEDFALYKSLSLLRRRLAFKNPLLRGFDKILFLTHDRIARGEAHMCDQFFGFNQRTGGGVFVLENPFAPDPADARARPLLASPVVNGRLAGRRLGAEGAFVGLALDYDARRIAFAYTEAKYRDLPADDAAWRGQPAGDTFAASRKQSRHAHHYYWRPESAFHLFTADLETATGSATGGATGGVRATNLRQLTDSRWNDIHPCFLPNGRLAFVSDRRASQTRCSSRAVPCTTLHSLALPAAGTAAARSPLPAPTPLSFHETSEWFPSVANDGRLLYTRWDYIDRDSDIAHHPWSCRPDGTNPLALHGNYPATPDSRGRRPWMEMSIRAIPDSPLLLAVAAPHHGHAYGSVVLVDPRVPDDGEMSQVRRVTPEHFFPESEILPGVVRQYVRGTDGNAIAARRTSEAEAFGTPWPLSEKYFLAVRSRHLPANSAGGARTAPKSNPVPVEPHGIYLCDIFGNRELLFRDPRHSALDPIPLAPRPRPPVIPSAVPDEFAAGSSGGSASAAAGSTGTVSIVNIYESERPFPAGVKIAAVRVVQIHPKPNFHETDPRVGIGAQSLVRSVLGTAPVEPDGSAHFECPAGVEIYFQALDADGLAVQTMRSGTYLHAGETMSCVGCHENRLNAPPPRAGTPLALRRAPSRLRPETKTGSAPVDFARLVQPVLDKHCVSCHGGSGGRGAGSGEIVRAAGKPPMKTASPAAKKSLTVKPSLRGDVFAPHGWSAAYTALTAGHATPRSWAWARCGGNGSSVRHREDSFSVPGAVGARASRLWTFLKRGHGTKNFSADDWRRVSLWLDTNSVFFGTYRPVPPVPPVVKPPPVPPVPVAVAKKP